MKRPLLRSLPPMLRTLDTSIARTPPKRADPELLTPDHRAWRIAVLQRAGYRCQQCGVDGARTFRHTDDLGDEYGKLVRSAGPTLYADHIVERKDGGALYDPANGRCLCASCHVKKTIAARAARMAR